MNSSTRNRDLFFPPNHIFPPLPHSRIHRIRSANPVSDRQDDQLKTLFTWAKEPKLLGRCKGEEITGIQAAPVTRDAREVAARDGWDQRFKVRRLDLFLDKEYESCWVVSFDCCGSAQL